MVQSLPGFLDLCLNVCSPRQVLGDVYTEVLEAAHPLHRGPTDHKRSVGPLLSLPDVYNQLFSFAHVQRETGKIGALFTTSNYLDMWQGFHNITDYKDRKHPATNTSTSLPDELNTF